MFDFKIAETKTFEKIKKTLNKKVYEKINSVVYPQLRSNPFFGTNIKKLKGEFAQYYRYRIGDYRLFYLIDNDQVFVVIVDLRLRKDAYQ